MLNCNLKYKEIFFVFIYFSLILSYIFSVFSYLDEIIGVVALIYIFINIFLYRQNKRNLILGSVIVIFIALGLGGNFFYNEYSPNIKNILIDLYLFIKPYLYLLFGICLFKNHNRIKLSYYMSIFSKILIIMIFIPALIYLFRNLTNFSDWRFKIADGFPGDIATISILSLVWIFDYNYSKNKGFYFIICALIVVLTGSGLGLLGIVLFFIFYYFLKKFKFKKYMFIIFALVVFLVSKNEISNYLANDSAPRYKMFYYSFKTAISFFPFGSGYGTYGGVVAATDYSKLYILYGFNNVWGLSKESLNTSHNFLYDTYYPMIIAQFGFIGIISYLIIIFLGLKKSFLNKNKTAIFMILFLLAMGLGFNIGGLIGCLYCLTLGSVAYKSWNRDKGKDVIISENIGVCPQKSS